MKADGRDERSCFTPAVTPHLSSPKSWSIAKAERTRRIETRIQRFRRTVCFAALTIAAWEQGHAEKVEELA